MNMRMLTRTRSTDNRLPGLTGAVRQVTATDPAVADLFQAALAAGRAVEEAKHGLGAREEAAKARQGDMLNQLEDVRELRVARAQMDALQRVARAAHQAWSEGVIVAVRATYRDQIQRKAALLSRGSALEIEHDGFIEDLDSSGVSGFAASLRPMSLGRGELRLDRLCSTATLWMAEAKSFGLLDA